MESADGKVNITSDNIPKLLKSYWSCITGQAQKPWVPFDQTEWSLTTTMQVTKNPWLSRTKNCNILLFETEGSQSR